MEIPGEMTTVSEVMQQLHERGIDQEFKWLDKGFTLDSATFYQPADLEIIKIYRFEEDTDPEDSAVLYLIRTNDNQLGYSLDAYGVYSSHDGEEGYNGFIRQISVKGHSGQAFIGL